MKKYTTIPQDIPGQLTLFPDDAFRAAPANSSASRSRTSATTPARSAGPVAKVTGLRSKRAQAAPTGRSPKTKTGGRQARQARKHATPLSRRKPARKSGDRTTRSRSAQRAG